jgi:type IX secretion system PorP/SprF family membrane protein
MLSVDHFLERYSSGVGLMWLCDNQGRGLLTDNNISLLYAYEFAINQSLFVRPGLSFSFLQRKLDQSKMITYTDITADGKYVTGGSSIEFDRTRATGVDAGASVMVYNSDFWVGASFDHLMQPNVSFTDVKDKIGMKITAFAGYKLTYQDSYRGSEPKTVTFAVNYKHQYSFNQIELGAYWYYAPIEVGVAYRGLFFQMAGEINNIDAIIPSVGVNIGPLRVSYAYDMTISDLSTFGNGSHEVSLMYRVIPSDVKRRTYKMKPVPCTEPIMGYSYSGKGKNRSVKRTYFKR